MPLGYQWSLEGELSVTPVIICDTCGEQIAESRYANVLWERLPIPTTSAPVSKTTRVFFAHKGACDAALTQRLALEGVELAFGELQYFPARLLGALGYPELVIKTEQEVSNYHRLQAAPTRADDPGDDDLEP